MIQNRLIWNGSAAASRLLGGERDDLADAVTDEGEDVHGSS